MYEKIFLAVEDPISDMYSAKEVFLSQQLHPERLHWRYEFH